MIPKETKEQIIAAFNECEVKSKIECGKRFLEITGLKVGDKVMSYFSYNSGDSKRSYCTGGYKEGIIKEKESGILFIESVEKLKVSYEESNRRSGRDRRSWWVYKEEHISAALTSIQVIGDK